MELLETIVAIVLLVGFPFLIIKMLNKIEKARREKNTTKGSFIGKCVDKYTSQDGGIGGFHNQNFGITSGNNETSFYLTFEYDGQRKSFQCENFETFGKVKIDETVEVFYKLVYNTKWITDIKLVNYN